MIGAGGVIGKGTAQRFVEEGANVVLADWEAEVGEASADKPQWRWSTSSRRMQVSIPGQLIGDTTSED